LPARCSLCEGGYLATVLLFSFRCVAHWSVLLFTQQILFTEYGVKNLFISSKNRHPKACGVSLKELWTLRFCVMYQMF